MGVQSTTEYVADCTDHSRYDVGAIAQFSMGARGATSIGLKGCSEHNVHRALGVPLFLLGALGTKCEIGVFSTLYHEWMLCAQYWVCQKQFCWVSYGNNGIGFS